MLLPIRASSRIASVGLVALLGSMFSSAWAQDAPESEAVEVEGGFTVIDIGPDGITDADRDSIAADIAAHESAFGSLAFRSSVEAPPLYSFFPVSGTLHRDLTFVNYVDLDLSFRLLDWNCTQATYDGHNGHDVNIRTFGEQAIGVPILAALDGRVISARDGHFDMNTTGQNGQSNTVVIDHGFGRRAWYLHMKRGSVAVSRGELVKAGQQIGMVGSSGRSTWPHLHFETGDRGSVYEPFAGPCHPGPSGWTDQPPVRPQTEIVDFGITPPGESVNLPFDPGRTGTLVLGFQRVAHWLLIQNGPPTFTYRFRYRKPDGTLAYDTGTRNWFRRGALRFAWAEFAASIPLDVPGTWHVDWDMNGQTILSAPFEVVADPSQIVNRPPHPIQAYLDPADYTPDDVVFCRVSTDLALDDPDYDIVHYEYEWFADDEALRSTTGAGQADAIPRHTLEGDELLECRVTPSDGTHRGDTVSTLCGDLDPTCIRVSIRVVSTINTARRGVVPVIVFGSETFDVTGLDPTSLRFGPNGAATAHDLTEPLAWNDHLDDVDLDGFTDLVTHYRVGESGIAPEDESADLAGRTLDRRPLKGSGPIQTVN